MRAHSMLSKESAGGYLVLCLVAGTILPFSPGLPACVLVDLAVQARNGQYLTVQHEHLTI